MHKSQSIGRYHYSILLLTLLSTACTAPTTIIAPSPVVEPSPPIPVVAPIVPATPLPVTQNDPELYRAATIKADAARAIGQSAASKDDWLLVANNLENSVEILKSIAPTSPQYRLAAQVLPEYEQQLSTARQKAASFVAKSPISTTTNQVASIPNSDTFTIPIQQKLGGVPLIEVTFNDNQKVPMLLDTGASHTLVTLAIASQLQLRSNGSAQAKTANGTATFSVANIDKIKFGDGEVKNIQVAIGQNDLPYGLLGHDVYDGYDMTIKASSIEFHKRP